MSGEMTVTANGLDEVGRADDDTRVDLRRSCRHDGRALFGRLRPRVERLPGLRIDTRRILPVSLVELENVRGIDSRELAQVHNLLIVTRLVCPSRAADGGFSPFHA